MLISDCSALKAEARCSAVSAMWSVAMARRLIDEKMLVSVEKNIAIVANIMITLKWWTTCHLTSFAGVYVDRGGSRI